MTRQILTERQRQLIQNYAYSQMQMTPQDFLCKWELTYEEVSLICSRSPGTVSSWFSPQKKHRPTRNDMRHLALLNFLLENYESIPEDIINLLCPPYLD
ncbi:helix-turn-helix domain-containing protein [Coleofasciculus sp. FACHB-501]|uniref:helix-turn-helix domain-containing protein n=1 Tax=Cyanophyceae TaxID=3028117 RepID=UPI0016879177|nr:helix-turn-helix domain-containing protein [Coleofasciculus sp. FACHB-501]MBD1838875.1 helix-turn-helix domain-containing protein [Coleofasciculus sp. FACHB-501]